LEDSALRPPSRRRIPKKGDQVKSGEHILWNAYMDTGRERATLSEFMRGLVEVGKVMTVFYARLSLALQDATKEFQPVIDALREA
jgi:hypothetical protein